MKTLALLSIALAFAAAPAQRPGKLEINEPEYVIRAFDGRFSPSTITVPAKTRVRFILVNEGKEHHGMVFEMGGKKHMLLNLPNGRRQALLLMTPETNERITFYDPKFKDRMQGTIIVAGSRIGPPASDVGNVRKITLTANALGLNPRAIRVKAGEFVQVTFRNEDSRAAHGVVFELDRGSAGTKGTLQKNGSQTFTFRAPTRSGTYKFYDPTDKRREGKLIVDAK